MHAVVNKLPLCKPIDDSLVESMLQGIGARMCESPDFVSVHLVSVSDDEAIFVVMFKTREALDDLSKNVAGPWFAEHFRPYLSGPVQRSVGEVVAHIEN